MARKVVIFSITMALLAIFSAWALSSAMGERGATLPKSAGKKTPESPSVKPTKEAKESTSPASGLEEEKARENVESETTEAAPPKARKEAFPSGLSRNQSEDTTVY